MAALPGEGTGSSDEDEPPNDTKKRQGFKARKITHRTVKTRNREMSTFAMPIAYVTSNDCNTPFSVPN